MKVNEGEVPQYYVENSHPAIIDHITVYNDGRLVFTFRNGSEETVMM